MKVWQAYSEKNHLGYWENWGESEAPEGIYWYDAGYEEFEGIEGKGKIQGLSGRLMAAQDLVSEGIAMKLPWVIIREGKAIYIGHYLNTKELPFLKEHLEPLDLK